MKRSIVSVLLLVIGASWSLAQTNIRVEGTILSGDDLTPIPGANIFLLSDWSKGTVSVADGRFVLDLPKDHSTDTLVFSFVSFSEFKAPIILNQDTVLTVKLQPLTILMEELIVEGRRLIAEEFTIKEINQLDIYVNPNAKADALLAVNSMPFSTTTDESANVSLRGSGPAETGIFFDDVPIYDAIRFSQLNGIGTFSIFNTAIIKGLNVYPGNPPLEYGNTTSGLISIASDDRIPESNSNSLSINLVNVGFMTSQRLSERSGLKLFSNLQSGDALRFLNKSALENLRKFHTVDAGVHFVQQFKGGIEWKIFNYFNDEGYDFFQRDPAYHGIFNQSKTRNFTVSNLRKTFERSAISINSGFSISDTRFNYGNINASIDNQDIYFAANYHFSGEKLSVKSGVSLDQRRLDFSGVFPTIFYAIRPSDDTEEFKSKVTLNVVEAFGYLKYELNDQFILGGGVRKNLPEDGQTNYLSAQGNLRFAPDSKNGFNLSIGKYHRHILPQGDEMEGTFFESDQVSLDYGFKNSRIEFNTSVFGKRTFRGNSLIRTNGIEIFTAIKWNNKLKSQLSYTLLNGEVEEDESRYPSPFDLAYFIRGNIEFEMPGDLMFNSTFIYRQGTHFQPLNMASFNPELGLYEPTFLSKNQMKRLPDYLLVDLNMSRIWTINDTMGLVTFVGINNLLDRKNIRGINYNMDYSQPFDELFSQRTFFFGGVLNF